MRSATSSPIEFILASASPRRRELLRRAGYQPRIVVPKVDERPRPAEAPGACARRLARAKVADVARRLPPPRHARIVLGCDTVVAVAGAILGKPLDAAEALRMLRRLSRREHSVISGVAMLRQAPSTRDRWRVFSVETRVRFRRLGLDELQAYIATGDPMDKAGAYGLQEGAAQFVWRIRGSVTNVIGLPLAEVVVALRRWGLKATPVGDRR